MKEYILVAKNINAPYDWFILDKEVNERDCPFVTKRINIKHKRMLEEYLKNGNKNIRVWGIPLGGINDFIEWYREEDEYSIAQKTEIKSDMHGDEEVIVKKINNFEEFGFSGDFKGEILKEVGDFYIGYYQCIKSNAYFPCAWHLEGSICYGFDCKYSLTTIKKEWYELEENIGRLLTNGTSFMSFDKRSFDNKDGKLLSVSFRLATNEEIEALKTKDN